MSYPENIRSISNEYTAELVHNVPVVGPHGVRDTDWDGLANQPFRSWWMLLLLPLADFRRAAQAQSKTS